MTIARFLGVALAVAGVVAACGGSVDHSGFGDTGGSGGSSGSSGGSGSGSGSGGSSSGGGSGGGAAVDDDGGVPEGGPPVLCMLSTDCPSGQTCCGAKLTGTHCEAACMKGERKACESSRTDCGTGEHCKMELGFGLCEASKVGTDGGSPSDAGTGGD